MNDEFHDDQDIRRDRCSYMEDGICLGAISERDDENRLANAENARVPIVPHIFGLKVNWEGMWMLG